MAYALISFKFVIYIIPVLIPGNEFVGEILEVGENALKFAPGDWVVPFATGMGTWTSHAIYSESSLLKVPKELGIVKASTMTVNPTTAYRMLKEYVTLVPGRTCVIQNGANSAVGQAVIQLCKAWGLKSVGIVRNRPEIADLKKFLKQLGADEVLTEEEVRSTQIFKEKKYDKPKLGLNCVGGKSSTEMLRHLADKAVMVTYGGMSREPITIPTSALIFKDICFHGFWMTRWTAENAGNPLRMKMFDDLIDLMLEDKLKGPVASEVPIDNYQLALANALSFQGFVGQKYILTF